MGKVIPDPETGSPMYINNEPRIWGSTDTYIAGSAVIPSSEVRFDKYVPFFNNFIIDDSEESIEYIEEFRSIIIKQLKKDVSINEQTYKAKKVYGIVIFCLSVLLVLAGIVFSIVQFINAMKIGDFSMLETSLEIQAAGNLMITTSAIGAFVLTLSIGFFFLFLQFVYKPNSKRRDVYESFRDIKKMIDK